MERMQFRIMTEEKRSTAFTDFTVQTAIFGAMKTLHGQVGCAVSIELLSNRLVTENVSEIELEILSQYKVKVHSALTFLTKCGDNKCAVLAKD